jgi:glucose/mannose-6-phosphate isomerase
MNLDQWQEFQHQDPDGMLSEIDRLPDQLRRAWELGGGMPMPKEGEVRNIVLVGMGGSAIGADLLQAYVAAKSSVPIIVWRNYGLPAFVNDGSLVITTSHSGNTEEILSAFDRAQAIGARTIAVTTGGKLFEKAREAGVPTWQFEHVGQPRAAVGFSFALLLAIVFRLGLIPDPTGEIEDAVQCMRDQQKDLYADVPLARNPAKRMAGQLMGRWPTVIGADFLAPVARRWRTQIAEIAKAVAQFEELPEADHNLVAGVLNPEQLFAKTMVVLLQASQYHPRNALRTDVTREVLMVEGFNADVIHAQGDHPLAQQWTTLHFGDYVSFYLAMSYGVDPSPVPAIQDLKARLREYR